MKKIFIYLLLFILLFCYSYFLGPNISDEIWNYGFSYNIAKGLIIYRDFNVLQTPLLFFLGSVFVFIFGHHLWSVHILNAIILFGIFIILHKSLGNRCFIIIPFILFYCLYSYSLLCLLFILLILYVNENDCRYRDYIIGLLVSLMFLTKQNIGIVIFVPMFIYSKNKFKSVIIFLIPIIIFCMYFIYYDAFYSFIDNCFLGMLEFGESNSYYSYLTGLWIISVLFFAFLILKSKFKNRDAFYILGFHVICIPIFDWYHFIFILILFLYYVLKNYYIEEYRVKYFVVMSIFYYFFSISGSNIIQNFYIWSDKDSFMYGRNVTYPYFFGNDNIEKYILDMNDIYGDYIYIFSDNAYLIKLELGIRINLYDLILNGNMGYYGDMKRIKKLDNICRNDKCLFILDKDMVGVQINQDIRNYVIDNYNYIEDVDGYQIYSNGVI